MLLPAVFFLYILVMGAGIGAHELWGDELHSWNIAKASGTLTDLLRNSRYEGHPPVWYTVMWLLSRVTHQLLYLQLTHFLIVTATVWLLLFRSPLPVAARALIPFGYYFLFEYGMLSRNYAIGVLAAFGICVMLGRRGQVSLLPYYILLVLLANSHLLGLLLAGSIHLYLLIAYDGRPSGSRLRAWHAAAGLAIGAASLYTMLPPRDSSLGLNFWLGLWNARHHLGVVAAAPAKAMLPLPAWWDYHFWNTHFLLGAGDTVARSILSLAASGVVLAPAWFLFRKHRGSLLLFGSNLMLTVLVSMLISLSDMRYVGFIYISFLVAAWLMWARQPVRPSGKRIFLLFVLAQLPGGIFALSMDLRYPFSRGADITGLIRSVPPEARVVTDYWCLNTVAAYTDKPMYCIDLGREAAFLRWDTGLFKAMSSPFRYTQGFRRILPEGANGSIYLITGNPIELITRKDTLVKRQFRIERAGSREGAIERGSNLYLYRVRNAAPQHDSLRVTGH